MKKQPTNPFYILLVFAGVLFVITSCAYLTTTLQARESDGERTRQGPLAFVERNGLTLLVGELIVLGFATFGAIGTDEYWMRRARNKGDDSESPGV